MLLNLVNYYFKLSWVVSDFPNQKTSAQMKNALAVGVHACTVTRSCLTLCDPMDCSPPGSSVHGCPRQEYWCSLPLPIPGDLPDPRFEPTSLASPASAGGFFTAARLGTPFSTGNHCHTPPGNCKCSVAPSSLAWCGPFIQEEGTEQNQTCGLRLQPVYFN